MNLLKLLYWTVYVGLNKGHEYKFLESKEHIFFVELVILQGDEKLINVKDEGMNQIA